MKKIVRQATAPGDIAVGNGLTLALSLGLWGVFSGLLGSLLKGG